MFYVICICPPNVHPASPRQYFLRDDCEAVPFEQAAPYYSMSSATAEADMVRKTWSLDGGSVQVETVQDPAPISDGLSVARYRVHLGDVKKVNMDLTGYAMCDMQRWATLMQMTIKLWVLGPSNQTMDMDDPPKWCTPDYVYHPQAQAGPGEDS